MVDSADTPSISFTELSRRMISHKRRLLWSGEYNPDHFPSTVFAAFNFGDTELKDYELTLPGKGKITPLLNSDWNCFGGRNARPKALRSKTTTGSVKLTLAPYSAQLYRFEPAAEKETK